MPGLNLIVALLHAIAMMALMAVLFGVVQRTRLTAAAKSLAMGAIFGLGAISVMLAPVEVMPGVMIDGRSIFVGLGAAYSGPLGALAALILGAGFRIYLGGAGWAAGAVGISIAAVMGIVWQRNFSRPGRTGISLHMLAGVMISLQFVAVYLLPLDVANRMAAAIYPLLLVAAIVSSVVLGLLIERERKMINREQRLRSDAEIDFLTGLTNRRRFERDLADLRREAPGRGVSHTLVLLDIDHFKSVNDNWGHEAGDKVLTAFGRLLRQTCRPGDVIARIGGEEFALLLRGMPIGHAAALVERILESVRTLEVVVPRGRISVTASAGYAEFDSADTSAAAAMKAADRALYVAKRAGRNQARCVGLANAA